MCPTLCAAINRCGVSAWSSPSQPISSVPGMAFAELSCGSLIVRDRKTQKTEDGGIVDAIPGWNSKACQLFPTMCRVLQDAEEVSWHLFPSKERYTELMSNEGYLIKGYSSVPMLGMYLLNVPAGAGLVPHAGQMGRLVHSIGISVPSNPPATISVGGEVQPWVVGQFCSFDDSFVHQVDNPRPTDDRLVLSIVGLHPGLVPANLKLGKEQQKLPKKQRTLHQDL